MKGPLLLFSFDSFDTNIKTKVLSIEILQATQKDILDFKCDENTEIYHVYRQRFLGGHHFSLEYSRFNKRIVTYLNKEIAEGSIFHYIQDALNVDIGYADKIISARKINASQAKLLALEENDPGIVLEDTVYCKNGEIFDCSYDIYNYKYAKFFDLAKYKK